MMGTQTETVEYKPLRKVAGYYDKGRDVIIISSLITGRQQRAVLEHERIHRERGDMCSGVPWLVC